MYKTFTEIKDEVFDDLNLDLENFVDTTEFMRIINRAISSCESMIHKFAVEDAYFETVAPIALKSGFQEYTLPYNIYGTKIRRIVCNKSNDTYEIKRNKKLGRYLHASYQDNNSSSSNAFSYMVLNKEAPFSIREDGKVVSGGARIKFYPRPSEDTTVLTGTDITFISEAQSSMYPGVGVYYSVFSHADFASAMVGDFVIFGFAGVEDYTEYDFLKKYGHVRIEKVDGTNIYLDTSLPQEWEAAQFQIIRPDYLMYYIRRAKKVTDESDYVDIPEFYTYITQFCKVECIKKELGNPRLAEEKELLFSLRDDVMSTLTEMTPDQDDKLEIDNSVDEEMV